MPLLTSNDSINNGKEIVSFFFCVKGTAFFAKEQYLFLFFSHFMSNNMLFPP